MWPLLLILRETGGTRCREDSVSGGQLRCDVDISAAEMLLAPGLQEDFPL